MKHYRHHSPGENTAALLLAALLFLTGVSGCTPKESFDPFSAFESYYEQLVQILQESGGPQPSQTDAAETGVERLENGSLVFSDGGSFTLPDDLPTYTGEPSAVINDGIPHFEESLLTNVSRETYGELDALGRCTTALACLGEDLMPMVERGSIGMIRPSGWKTVRYDFIDGMYLYNRCHMIGYQLTGENDNERNLITGTRYMNVEGMLPYENQVAAYIHRTDGHVLYRVTPVFADEELLARGVLIEAESVEDRGGSISFNVFCFNVQPGVVIDYRTGDNYAA